MRRSDKRTFHFIYKTTCSVNSKFYYGMHSTDDLDDGYIGSGTRLWHSIRKHGRENFKVEILEFISSRQELKVRERELITEQMLLDPSCMNLKVGGEGGFTLSKEQYALRNGKAGKRGGKVTMKALHANPENRKKSNATRHLTTGFATVGMTGRSHSNESKEKMSNSHKGSSNSQHDSCWIRQEQESKKIKLHELDTYLATGWVRGKKMPLKLI